MKSKWLYFILLAGVILSALLFTLKLNKYYRKDSEFVYIELPHSSNSLQREYKYKPKLNLKNISYYENLFKSRNLFKVLAKEKELLPKKEAELQIDLEEEISNFELLGVASSGGKSQAIIKNKESGKIFYCRGGEKIDSFIVKEVLSDRIIFKRGENAAELRL